MNGFDHGSLSQLPNTLDIGPISIPLYGFLIMLGVIAAFVLGVREGKKIGIESRYIVDGILIILPLSLLGTRLWYVIFEWDQFKDYWPSIIGFEEGRGFVGWQGLAVHGGFFTAVVSTYVYARVRKIEHLLVRGLDIIVPGFLIAQSLGRWGNFFNQEAHGGVIGGLSNIGLWDAQRDFLLNTLRIPAFITDNMFMNGPDGWNYYHPTFLYESLWNIFGLIILLILRRTKFVRSGDMFAFYLIWYSAGRFMIESMRTDSLYLWNLGLRTAQVVSILMIVGGVVFIVLSHLVFKRKFYHEHLAENRVSHVQNKNTE